MSQHPHHTPRSLLLLGYSYNWSPAIITQDVKAALQTSGVENIPMIWGEKDLDPLRLENLEVLDQASYLLGFNEPNFGAQVRYNSMRKSKYLISTMYASLAHM